jgi:REP element-mobilizing transposase RayT
MRRVIAYHLIVTTYGFWLPNDPRGSWSDFVRAWELRRFGPATKTTEKRSLASDPHDRRLRLEAKKHLSHDAVEFTGVQARAVGRGFAQYATRSGCAICACAILPCHAHLVVARHRYSIEKIATLLKGAATTQLLKEERHPLAHQPYRNGTLPTPWARRAWSVFLDCVEDVERAVQYVVKNPVKEGKPRQDWSFVKQWES